MEHCKLQLGCLCVILYIAFVYLRERRRYYGKAKPTLFDGLLTLSILSVFFDGATAYTVNNTGMVDSTLNTVLHALFFISLDFMIFVVFLYMASITGSYPKTKIGKTAMFFPFVFNVVLVIANMDSLEYVSGNITNYSTGVSACSCFVMAVVYITMSAIVFFKRCNYIESRKRVSMITYLMVFVTVTGVQICFPETLISSIGGTICILGIYMNSEDPAIKELSHYHSEIVMSFANLIEKRDNSTGGHIKRTSMYVQLIAEELRSRGHYRSVLTKDYITNLVKAAPMHDIGKVSVPDSILQKPGRLTDDEFAVMKMHAENGGKIVKEIFENLGDEEYRQMAYEVARYHHEKWNGKGYPEGIKKRDIPLCARIMAVADVFDAVSEKRCYREALPIDDCFEIIEQGSGQDFDPLIVEVFVDIKDKIKRVHSDFAVKTK